MSEPDHGSAAAVGPPLDATGNAAAEFGPPAPPSEIPPPAPAAGGDRRLVAVLAVALVLIIVLAGTAPFWAPFLPWGGARDDAAIAARLDRLEATQQQTQEIGARLDRLEAAQHQTQGMGARLDSVEAAQRDLSQKTSQTLQNLGSAISTSLQPFEKRLAALEAKASVSPAALDELRQQVAKLSGTTSDQAARVAALDKAVHAQATNSAADVAALLALAQIRDAVETGRPFPAAYDALTAVVKGSAQNGAPGEAEIAQAVAPLADPAKSGVATRAVLIERLRAAKDKIAAAAKPESGTGWTDTALRRLGGLVTIRRIDKPATGQAAQTPAGTLDAAETALTGGDLAAAVTAIGTLSGRAADEAAPWLHMAQQRLAVETALRRIDALLTARLGQAVPPQPVGPASGGAGSGGSGSGG